MLSWRLTSLEIKSAGSGSIDQNDDQNVDPLLSAER